MVDQSFQIPRQRRMPLILRYVVTAVSIAGCAACWGFLAPHVEFEATLLLFVLPVLLATWFGGPGPGVLATMMALASALYLMPFEKSASVHADHLDLLLFATEAIAIVILTSALQRARDAAEYANGAKDTFVAVVSHELRAPLNVINGCVLQLQRRRGGDEMVNRALDRIERSARVQARILEDLLDVSRAMSGKLALNREPMPLSPVLLSAIDDVRGAADMKHVEVHADVNTDAIVDADGVRLTQVFSNLLANAVKFTPAGGTIDVRAGIAGDYVRVIVRDTGAGIPAAALPFVFEPFRQVDAARDGKAGGLGLGLAVVKQVVQLHGGRIVAESDGRNRGTRFIVDLIVTGAHVQNHVRSAAAPIG